MKVHKAYEAPVRTEIVEKAFRETHLRGKVDQKHFKCKLLTLSLHFRQKYRFSDQYVSSKLGKSIIKVLPLVLGPHICLNTPQNMAIALLLKRNGHVSEH